jgi:hypothetical protein
MTGFIVVEGAEQHGLSSTNTLLMLFLLLFTYCFLLMFVYLHFSGPSCKPLSLTLKL